MKRFYLITVLLLSTILGASSLTTLFVARSARAEAPPYPDYLEPTQATNVRRLLATNACADCNLVGVDLSQAHIIGADLRGADLTGANLTEANLEGADLTKANLTGANLTGAFLTNASLVGADLDNVNFEAAQLYFVDVTGASMDNLNLANATVVGTAIGIGGPIEDYEGNDAIIPIYDGQGSLQEEELPVLTPEDIWRSPPTIDPVRIEDIPTDLLDVPAVVPSRG